MLTTQDKKYIDQTIVKNIDQALRKNNEILIKGMRELFDATNERIDESNEKIDSMNKKIDGVNHNLSQRIDKVLAKLRDRNDTLNNHERRIEKAEEKVFPIST